MVAVERRESIWSRARRRPNAVYGILALALALRVAWVIYAAREPATFGDPFIYLQLARRIATGHGYGPLFSTGPTAFHPPGYPGWLVGVVWVAKLVGLDAHEPLLIGLLQALIGTASVALVYAIATRLFNPRIALIATALTAGFPNLIFYSALLYSETLYLFGVLLALWLIVRADWDPAPSVRVVVAFGLAVGLSSLVRPFAMLSLIALAVAALRAGAGWREAARMFGIAAGVAVLMLVPWTIRNAFAYHAFVPVSTNLGDTLCLDNSPGAYGGFRELPPECSPPAPRSRVALRPGQLRTGEFEPEQNSHDLHYAVSWALHHPGREAELVVRRAFYGYRDDHDGLTDPTGAHGNFPPSGLRNPLSRLADIYYYVVLALALVGARKFVGEPRRLFVLLVAATLAAVPLFLYGLIRFHIPLLPFLALGAAVSIDAFRPAQFANRRNSVI
jgi:4-amino-4-deoxy-L-arabinose transferase-like glycosyltransferase